MTIYFERAKLKKLFADESPAMKELFAEKGW